MNFLFLFITVFPLLLFSIPLASLTLVNFYPPLPFILLVFLIHLLISTVILHKNLQIFNKKNFSSNIGQGKNIILFISFIKHKKSKQCGNNLDCNTYYPKSIILCTYNIQIILFQFLSILQAYFYLNEICRLMKDNNLIHY